MQQIDDRMNTAEWTLQGLVDEFYNLTGVREYVIAKTLDLHSPEDEHKYVGEQIKAARLQKKVYKLWKSSV
tara:strand:+ start:6785 stop:6997 length:213 start_codon:yes stop_codon:yes gene_type:complete